MKTLTSLMLAGVLTLTLAALTPPTVESNHSAAVCVDTGPDHLTLCEYEPVPEIAIAGNIDQFYVCDYAVGTRETRTPRSSIDYANLINYIGYQHMTDDTGTGQLQHRGSMTGESVTAIAFSANYNLPLAVHDAV